MNEKKNIFFDIVRYGFIALLCIDLLVFAGTDIIKEPIFDLIMHDKGERVIFFFETEQDDPIWSNKSDAIYISESDAYIHIGVAKAQRSNWFISAMWSTKYIYLPKDFTFRYQIDKTTGTINIKDNGFLENGELFLSQVGWKPTTTYYVGYTYNEAYIIDEEFVYKEKYYFDNGLCGWIFVSDKKIGQNYDGKTYMLI